jgi:hypothetical protein
VTSIPELATSIKPVAIADLRVEARSMHSNEALLINLDGRAFVVITADAWADLVESAGRDGASLAPPQLDQGHI